MTEPEATGSRRERCALAAAFLLSETTQDAAVAASALVALQLFGGYEESLFIVIVMTMLLIGIQLSHVVGRRGWTLVLGGAAVCGAAGLAMMGAALVARVPRASIQRIESGAWSTLYKGYAGDVNMTGGGEFGAEYVFQHNRMHEPPSQTRRDCT